MWIMLAEVGLMRRVRDGGGEAEVSGRGLPIYILHGLYVTPEMVV